MTSPTHAPILGRTLILTILILCVPSCGSNNRPPCYPVHGEIFVGQGKDRTPAAGALVVFHPTVPASGEVPRPTAHVGEDGKFALTTYVKEGGAPAGDYAITIEWVPPRPPPPFKPKKTGDRLKGRYSDPQTSKFKYSVEKRSDNEVPVIELPPP
jgi:hypothetical protein